MITTLVLSSVIGEHKTKTANLKGLTIGVALVLLVNTALATAPACLALYRNGSHNISVYVVPWIGGIVTPEPGDYASGIGFSASGETYQLRHGQTITFTARAQDDYVFDGWYLNGNYEGNLTVITVTMYNSWELHALFSLKPGSAPRSSMSTQKLDPIVENLVWAFLALAVIILAQSIILGVLILKRKQKC